VWKKRGWGSRRRRRRRRRRRVMHPSV